MEKTKKKSKLFTVLAFALATLSAALLFMAAPRPVNADEPETIDYSKYTVVETVVNGDSLAGTTLKGKIIVYSGQQFGQISTDTPDSSILITGEDCVFMANGLSWAPIDYNDGDVIAALSAASGLSDINCYCVIPEQISGEFSETVLETENMVIESVETEDPVLCYLLSVPVEEEEEPSTGNETEEPSEQPSENQGETTETGTETETPKDTSETETANETSNEGSETPVAAETVEKTVTMDTFVKVLLGIALVMLLGASIWGLAAALRKK